MQQNQQKLFECAEIVKACTLLNSMWRSSPYHTFEKQKTSPVQRNRALEFLREKFGRLLLLKKWVKRSSHSGITLAFGSIVCSKNHTIFSPFTCCECPWVSSRRSLISHAHDIFLISWCSTLQIWKLFDHNSSQTFHSSKWKHLSLPAPDADVFPMYWCLTMTTSFWTYMNSAKLQTMESFAAHCFHYLTCAVKVHSCFQKEVFMINAGDLTSLCSFESICTFPAFLIWPFTGQRREFITKTFWTGRHILKDFWALRDVTKA